MSTSKQVYDKKFHCPECGMLLLYRNGGKIPNSINPDLLFCENCNNFFNLESDRSNIFVEVMSERRKVKRFGRSKFLLKDYQLRDPVFIADKKWMVYDLGREKIFYNPQEKSFTVEENGNETYFFKGCESLLCYINTRLVNDNNA